MGCPLSRTFARPEILSGLVAVFPLDLLPYLKYPEIMIAITNCHPVAIYILPGAENNRSIWFLSLLPLVPIWAAGRLQVSSCTSGRINHRIYSTTCARSWPRKLQVGRSFPWIMAGRGKHRDLRNENTTVSGLPVYSRLFGNDFYILSPNCSKLKISHPWELTWHIMAQCQCQCPISESSCRADFGGSILVFQAATPDRILQSPRNQKIVKNI